MATSHSLLSAGPVRCSGCELVTIEPLTAERGHRLVRLEVRGSADKVDKFDLGPITEAYDIELPAGDGEAAEVFVAVAHRAHEKYCTVGPPNAGAPRQSRSSRFRRRPRRHRFSS
jgi:hypothetical protein